MFDLEFCFAAAAGGYHSISAQKWIVKMLKICYQRAHAVPLELKRTTVDM